MNYAIKQIVLALLSVLLPVLAKWIVAKLGPTNFPWMEDQIIKMIMDIVQWVFSIIGGGFAAKGLFTSQKRLLAKDSGLVVYQKGTKVSTRGF